MGRFWQTLILRHADTVFSLVPIETTIKEHQREYFEESR